MPQPWIVLALASANFFLSQFYRATNAVISPHLLQDLHLDTEGLGVLSAAFFYSFALAQIPISFYLDRIGARKMMSALSLLGMIGVLLFSVAESLTTGVAGRLLLGAGMACNLMGTLKLLTVWFPPSRFATLSGIIFSLGFVGNMAATTPLVWMANLMGWRLALQSIAGIHCILILVFSLVVRDQPDQGTFTSAAKTNPQNLRDALSNLRSLLRNRNFWIISFGSFSSYGVFAAFQVLWAGPYFMEVMGLPAEEAGNLIFFANVALILGGSTWGTLSDKILKTRKGVVVGGHVAYALTAVSMAFLVRGTALAALAAIFFSFAFFRTSGLLMYSHIKELVPLGMAGMAMTGINFFTMVGPAVFLQGLGRLMQSLYPHASRGPDAFRAAFMLCSGFLLCVSLLYLFTKDTKPQR